MHKTVKYAGIALAVATAIINANELDFDKVEVSANEISNTQKPFALQERYHTVKFQVLTHKVSIV
ncbi:hypothetical protein LMG7974_01225 [Campylobacter majalis]|uniref:Uncharacterized protein n=1 Tax=Campylobacter majalis TaxID=2790656 RepID=A0ABM8Q7R0_9BACT|nr:hypothetical protein [Campylobacter majalis]CAD7288914.1 hypothetical protein LMG7974_01225 [Campylobacter majalis]